MTTKAELLALAVLLGGCQVNNYEIDVRDKAGNCYRVREYPGEPNMVFMVPPSECRAIAARTQETAK